MEYASFFPFFFFGLLILSVSLTFSNAEEAPPSPVLPLGDASPSFFGSEIAGMGWTLELLLACACAPLCGIPLLRPAPEGWADELDTTSELAVTSIPFFLDRNDPPLTPLDAPGCPKLGEFVLWLLFLISAAAFPLGGLPESTLPSDLFPDDADLESPLLSPFPLDRTGELLRAVVGSELCEDAAFPFLPPWTGELRLGEELRTAELPFPPDRVGELLRPRLGEAVPDDDELTPRLPIPFCTSKFDCLLLGLAPLLGFRCTGE